MSVVDTAERLLALLGLLQHRWHWSAEELAERLEVTTRTVRRDVSRLRTYGYPVEAFAGHGGGYQLGRGASLPPLLLDDDETMAVAFGLGVVGVAAISGVAGVDDAAVSALGKIEQLLPLRLRSRLDELDAATVVPFRDPGSLPDRRIVMALAHAVSARRVTAFDYVDGRGTTTRREAEPARLVRLRHAWYLAAFDLGRDDWRTFRVDRIASVDVRDVPCSARTGPDPVELGRDGLARQFLADLLGQFLKRRRRRGAAVVYAVDVGRGQLHPKVAADSRVVNLEATDVRSLTTAQIPLPPALIVADVSFISLEKALPTALALAGKGADLVALVKPQFEVGRDGVGK
eukprot:gene17003-35238_t